jgi:hypothetical protein
MGCYTSGRHRAESAPLSQKQFRKKTERKPASLRICVSKSMANFAAVLLAMAGLFHCGPLFTSRKGRRLAKVALLGNLLAYVKVWTRVGVVKLANIVELLLVVLN